MGARPRPWPETWTSALCAWLIAAAFLIGFIAPFSRPAFGQETAVVQLESGAIRGKSADGLRVYLGIPYAAAPVGELRWRPPMPAKPWSGVRDAFAFGPACPQTGPLEATSDEDCLYLNVWTPAAGAHDKLPVMVWIHGGGFTFGASSQPEYEGSNLARQGVVVVSVNYRLGPLGFFVHPELSKANGRGVSGNYGLLDQIAALRWVRKNIAAFGGDPGKVTIFGQSAGSRSVSLLRLSPLAAGLFHRAIAQSGGPILGSEYLTPAFNGDMAEASQMGLKLTARLGCGESADTLACLRAKPSMEVVKTAEISTSIFGSGLFFAPVFDGWVLPRDLKAALASGRKADVPVMLGSTGNEGTTYLRSEKDLTVEKYRSFLRERFGDDARSAFDVFPASSDADVASAVDRFITVAVNAQPARFVARSARGCRAGAWLYRFTRTPDTARARELKAFHGVELAYVFGNMKESDGYNAKDRELSKQVMAYWVNFARNGDPNGAGLPKWPSYAPDTDENLDFGDSVRVEHGLYANECDFIDSMSRFRPGR